MNTSENSLAFWDYNLQILGTWSTLERFRSKKYTNWWNTPPLRETWHKLWWSVILISFVALTCFDNIRFQIKSSFFFPTSLWIMRASIWEREMSILYTLLMVSISINQDLVIGETISQYWNIPKYTWISPDQKTRKKIDQIAISRKWSTSCLDVRSIHLQ